MANEIKVRIEWPAVEMSVKHRPMVVSMRKAIEVAMMRVLDHETKDVSLVLESNADTAFSDPYESRPRFIILHNYNGPKYPEGPAPGRTKSEVLRQQSTPAGCCERNADMSGCDCLSTAIPDQCPICNNPKCDNPGRKH